ncbi:hypothetical protein [Streptomyces sp. AGS-58]|uniref:hypothetical protein n=1 Tax=unclassified Streptomyces TaxID=2593676 RepID=UPI0035A354F8
MHRLPSQPSPPSAAHEDPPRGSRRPFLTNGTGPAAPAPTASAPPGALGLADPRVAGAPFAVRISRLGLAMVEKAAGGRQLGS